MTYNPAFSTRTPYDPCAYNKEISESVAPYAYQMYDGKFENNNRCVYEVFTRPFDRDIVNIESDLTNRTRMNSRCPSQQYTPQCTKSSNCISTFDTSNPVVLAPEVCPIVYNNIRWNGGTGINHPDNAKCVGNVVKYM